MTGPAARSWRSQLLWTAIGLSVPTLLLVVVSLQDEFSIREMFSDPSETQEFDSLIGLVSMVGIFGWFMSAGASLLAWVVTRSGWFGALGALTAVMGADDAILFHDYVFPERFGIDEKVVLGALALVAILVLAYYRSEFRVSSPGLLVVVAVLFAVALTVDRKAVRDLLGLGGENYETGILVEESAKLLGIFAWLSYVVIVSASQMKPNEDSPASVDAAGHLVSA